MPELGVFLLVVVFTVVATGSLVWHYSRSSSMLEEWASEQGYEVVSAERRFLRRGPFFFTTAKGQEVFYVTVMDGDGRTRHAYVRVGGFFLGLFSNNVDVRWEDGDQ